MSQAEGKAVKTSGGPNRGGRECVETLDPQRKGRWASWIVSADGWADSF